MRLFVALPVPSDVSEDLTSLQSHLAVGRPVPPEQMHLTLAFMRDEPESRLDDMIEALGTLRGDPVFVEWTGLDLMGGDRARALALVVRPNEALHRLEKGVLRALRSVGCDLPRRRFRPHITIARLGRNPGPDQERALRAALQSGTRPSEGFLAERMLLVRSTLGSSPPRHDVVGEFPLGATAFDDLKRT